MTARSRDILVAIVVAVIVGAALGWFFGLRATPTTRPADPGEAVKALQRSVDEKAH